MGAKIAQCFSCYDSAMFQYFGQSEEYDPKRYEKEYTDKLEDGTTVDCVTCGDKKIYLQIPNGKWRGELL